MQVAQQRRTAQRCESSHLWREHGASVQRANGTHIPEGAWPSLSRPRTRTRQAWRSPLLQQMVPRWGGYAARSFPRITTRIKHASGDPITFRQRGALNAGARTSPSGRSAQSALDSLHIFKPRLSTSFLHISYIPTTSARPSVHVLHETGTCFYALPPPISWALARSDMRVSIFCLPSTV